MAKRFFNLEKETKGFLKSADDFGISVDYVSSLNDFILKQKALGLDATYFSKQAVRRSSLLIWLDAASYASYPKTGSIWTDISNSGNNGTLVNSPVYSPAYYGGIDFDGTNRYVTIADNSRLYTFPEMTLEVAARVNNTANNFILAQKFNYTSVRGYGIELYTTVQGYCSNFGFDTVNYPISNIQANKVYLYTLTKIGNLQSLYINGILVATLSSLGQGSASTSGWDFRIGARSNAALSNSSLLSGTIYSVKLYNQGLSAREVAQNFNMLRFRYGL